MISMKTGDIVTANDRLYEIKDIELTAEGAVLSTREIANQATVFHIDEVSLADLSVRSARVKALDLNRHVKSQKTVSVPNGLSDGEAERVLAEYARKKQQKG